MLESKVILITYSWRRFFDSLEFQLAALTPLLWQSYNLLLAYRTIPLTNTYIAILSQHSHKQLYRVCFFITSKQKVFSELLLVCYKQLISFDFYFLTTFVSFLFHFTNNRRFAFSFFFCFHWSCRPFIFSPQYYYVCAQ